MNYFILLVIVIVTCITTCYPEKKRFKYSGKEKFIQKVEKRWEYVKKLKLIPDLLVEAPYQVLQVYYEGDLKVEQGNVLTPTQVKNQPHVHYIADPKAFYLLCMIDPDAPSRKDPKFREWHHWLVGNIPGFNVAAGEVLSEYIGAGPPEDTGLHRYVFLVYKQPGKLTFDEPKLTCRSSDGRANFSIRNFAAKYKLGEPFAGNVYQAKWDNYVPKLYEQLGG